MLDTSYLQDYDVPRPQGIKIHKKLYAKAIYDNFADSPDELAFKKGDVLTVIEQDTDGLEGWWLCSLRGREGLCPGNRLRILNSYDSGCFSLSPPASPCPSLAPSLITLNSNSTACYDHLSLNSSSSSSSHHLSNANAHGGVGLRGDNNQQTHLLTQQQRQGTRRSWHVSPNKVITPQRHGDVYIYNWPAGTSSTVSQHRHSQPHQQQLYQNQQQSSQQHHYSNQSIYQNISIMSAAAGSANGNDFETYDTPKPPTPVNYDCPKNMCRTPTQLRFGDALQLNMKVCSTPIQEESYDVPRPLNNALIQHQNTLTPSSSNSSLLTSDSLSLSFSSSNRSSLANMPDYDVPRRNPLPVRAVQQQQEQLLLQQKQHQPLQIMNGSGVSFDFPLASNVNTPIAEKTSPNAALMAAAATKELPLELCSALYTLDKLQTEATNAITKLLSFVTPSWRQREKLEPVLMDVKLTAVRLRTALHDLSEFGEGTLGNATRSEDRNLALKLRPHVRALRDADKLIHDTTETLEAQGWTLEHLMRSDEKFKSVSKPPDSLDQLIACAQTLTEDVRQTTSFIHGNASLLFKRSLRESGVEDGAEGAKKGEQTHQNEGTMHRSSLEWVEDYDYVSFESKDAAAKKNSALRDAIPPNLKKNFDTVIKAAETTIMAASNVTPTTPSGANNTGIKKQELTSKDKKLVCYYAVQISTHMGNLQQAIDSFLETVEKNQPPKFFIAYGKFVVVSAHNLVTIGDIVHRNVSKVELREKILRCTDALSDALKTCVQKSKKAAAQFPSVTAVQEMVDSVVDISHLAADLKIAMLQAVQLSL
ncbi:breast cancer anti-estrogen resistance protein 1 isoform X2 [Eurosta solidaginis]|uniref:breast cancer anti-estrogen resistance protein 1 isoform X2 n=1 Tax=Eurosta solidaginis TaxID=178769 RepID=UPI00353150AB